MSADEDFEALVEFIRTERGFDFTGYKRGSLRRRVEKRMADVGIGEFHAYVDHLQTHPDEFELLFNTILINVTRFFRDPDHWAYLEEEILPGLVARAGDNPIRVWSAGCSSGEEAYSLAIALGDALGEERFVEQVKVYATDVDDEALTQARRARYPSRLLDHLPDDRRGRWFVADGDDFVARPELRSAVIFGRHDLVHDAPISRLDLLACRNVLMYFNSDTQGRILRNLHFALTNHGVLFLGKAEMLLTRTKQFTPIDLSHRLFSKITDGRGAPPVSRDLARLPTGPTVPQSVQLRDAAFSVSPVASLTIDLDGILTLANDQAQRLFGLRPSDVGRPFAALDGTTRPVELVSAIEQSYRDRAPVHLTGVDYQDPQGDAQTLDIWITPLSDAQAVLLGVAITFHDVTSYAQLRAQLQHSQEELETAYEELQSTNEELETSNEELQSTNEELETTNEELQSSNEELETMNEELQSANAEQEEFNRMLARSTRQLDEANGYHTAVVSSLPSALIVVGMDFGIRTWNEGAFHLWGLRSKEVVNRSLLNLDIGLPVAALADPIRAVLVTGEPSNLEIDAVTRLGRPARCRIGLSPVNDAADERIGVALLMTTAEGPRTPQGEGNGDVRD